MRQANPFLIGTAILFSHTFGIADPQADSLLASDPTKGFLLVTCDSLGMEIYVDELPVGRSPLQYTLPLAPGVHEVTYISPQFVALLEESYGKEETLRLFAKAYSRVWINPGETSEVRLWWQPFRESLAARKKERLVRAGIGSTMIILLLTLVTQPAF